MPMQMIAEQDGTHNPVLSRNLHHVAAVITARKHSQILNTFFVPLTIELCLRRIPGATDRRI